MKRSQPGGKPPFPGRRGGMKPQRPRAPQRPAAAPAAHITPTPVRLSAEQRQQAETALNTYADSLGLTARPAGFAPFLVRYQEHILGQNEAVNLTTIVAPGDFLVRHLFDSLATVKAVPELPAAEPLQIIDVGTGAGFPGVPLWAALQQHHYTLIDGTAKKVRCVEAAFRGALDECMAEGVWEAGNEASLELLAERAELLTRGEPRRVGAYDLVLARATGPGVEVFEHTQRLLKPGGRLVLYFTEHPARGEAELLKDMEKRGLPCDPGKLFEIRHGEHTLQRRHCVVTVG